MGAQATWEHPRSRLMKLGCIRRSGETFRVIERHTRVDADALEYRATAEDPAVYVYTRPFTVLRELTRDDGCAMGRCDGPVAVSRVQ